MPISLDHITDNTPMGANLVADGATFRVWAPNALAVYITGDFNNKQIDDTTLLNKIGDGHWAGFVPGVVEWQQYMFYVQGLGSKGPKRDPCARELTESEYYEYECIIRDPAFPWHDTGFVTPRFEDLVIYQLHVGVFYAPRLPKGGTFLDVASKIPYLSDLGITAIQLLPIQEFYTQFSMGYNNVDFYSPEMDFAVIDPDLPPYLDAVNSLLTAKGLQPYTLTDLRGGVNQLKALIDLCHCYGLAVIFDLVYNHAGGQFGDESIFFLDRQTTETNSNSLYFTDVGFVGGLVFDYTKPQVRDFLIQNTVFFADEYRVDGFRFDEVSTIDHDGQPDGWSFCQDLTSTLKYHSPSKFLLAEYWGVNPLVVTDPQTGIGFNATLTDGLRTIIRDVISNSSQPDERPLGMANLGAAMWPGGFWEDCQFVQGPENHDIVYINNQQRMARLTDPSNPRSWYGTSRSRVSTGITMTAPGIPMLFMGQEFLEDKQWADDFEYYPNQFIYWAGLDIPDKQMNDYLRFTRELIKLRWQHPGLRGQGFATIHSSDQNRVLAFQRWMPGEGKNVVVVVNLSNSTWYNYGIGFPIGGFWNEIFNSDVYENWVNPMVAGNGTGVYAPGAPLHGLGYSASLVLPANGLVVFAQ